MTLSFQACKPTQKYPRDLKLGDTFRIRPATNAKKFKVTGIVLKICRENGFKNFHSEDHGKVHIPVDDYNGVGVMILKPEQPIYVL
jgi:hypothetical protein